MGSLKHRWKVQKNVVEKLKEKRFPLEVLEIFDLLAPAQTYTCSCQVHASSGASGYK